MAWSNYEEPQNKLSFKDWKVFIDNSSQWYDDINKRLALCYVDTKLIKHIYPQIRSFTSSRKANLQNFNVIDKKLKEVKEVLYSQRYNELQSRGDGGEWDNKILNVLDSIIQLLSEGLSESELTPKPNKAVQLPYEKVGDVTDIINKSIHSTNHSSLNKNGEIKTSNNKR